MAATSAPAPAGRELKRPGIGWFLHDGAVVARRNLIQALRVPESIFFSLVQPVIFVFMFAYVFGGAIPVPGADPGAGADAYRQYLIPGIFGQTVAFAAAASTVGLADDLHKGIVDRFRSLPMAASAVLIGRTAADALQQIGVLVVLSITGFIVGWRISNGVGNAVLAYLLLLLFAYTVAWVGAWVGLHMPNPQTASTAGLIWLFPLTFLSNAFVPLAGMPTVVRTIAEWNPVSSLVLACRELFGNPTGVAPQLESAAWPMQYPVAYTLISCAVVIAVFSTLAVRKYRANS